MPAFLETSKVMSLRSLANEKKIDFIFKFHYYIYGVSLNRV